MRTHSSNRAHSIRAESATIQPASVIAVQGPNLKGIIYTGLRVGEQLTGKMSPRPHTFSVLGSRVRALLRCIAIVTAALPILHNSTYAADSYIQQYQGQRLYAWDGRYLSQYQGRRLYEWDGHYLTAYQGSRRFEWDGHYVSSYQGSRILEITGQRISKYQGAALFEWDGQYLQKYQGARIFSVDGAVPEVILALLAAGYL